MSENWSVAGSSIILEPGQEETLLEWVCPEESAAILTSYDVGMDNYAPLIYLKLPHPGLEIHLAFEQVSRPHQSDTEKNYTIHLNPNKWIQHPFSVAVKLIATNKSENEMTLWGLLKGKQSPIFRAWPSPTFPSSKADPAPAPVQPYHSNPPRPVTPPTTPVIVSEEKIMTPADDLSNSHDDLQALFPNTLGIVKEGPADYAEGDIAALHFDTRGRLLVANDGFTDRAEKQTARLAELELDNVMEIQRQLAADKQKLDSKYLLKRQKISLKRDRSADTRDEAVNRTDNRAKTVISGRRYSFLATLVRWAAVAGSAITMTYFLVS